jgi:uncharacterized protein (DUF427 family)
MSTTTTKSNSGPGYKIHPKHRLRNEATAQRVRAVFNGETIADTTRALVLWEADYPACYYIPREDVRDDLITGSETDTYCPFKGTASYWTFEVDGKVAEDAAWSYETPFDEVMELKGRLAFYTDRVDELVVDDPG